jgi:transcriptional regulator with XRE-family HTH domain
VAGWTQAQAAAALGLTEDGYAQLERGRRKVQAPIARLAPHVAKVGSGAPSMSLRRCYFALLVGPHSKPFGVRTVLCSIRP